MNVLYTILPIVGVIIGAALQHIFSLSKHRSDQLRIRQLEAYADYVRGVANVSHNPTGDQHSLFALIADAKTRITIFGSHTVLEALADFEKTSKHLLDEQAQKSFTKVVIAMRKDLVQSVSSTDCIQPVLFGELSDPQK